MPFIDFLLCLLAFLMMTAIWSQMARLEAAADGAGQGGADPLRPQPTLHLTVGEKRFDLAWRQGATVVDTRQLPRPETVGAKAPRYTDLSRVLGEEWQRHGVHRAASDPRQDRLVLHTSNALPFEEVVAVMDALNATKRGGSAAGTPAFAVSFAVD